MPSLPRLSGVSEGSYTSSVWSKVVACSTIFKLLSVYADEVRKFRLQVGAV